MRSGVSSAPTYCGHTTAGDLRSEDVNEIHGTGGNTVCSPGPRYRRVRSGVPSTSARRGGNFPFERSESPLVAVPRHRGLRGVVLWLAKSGRQPLCEGLLAGDPIIG